jgi:hypothetical protein
MKKWLPKPLFLAALVLLLGPGSFPQSTAGSSIPFDPNGTGTSQFDVFTIDPLPGNVLMVNSRPFGNNTFDVYYQARVGNLLDSGGNAIQGTGLNTNYEMTVVSKFSVTASGDNSTATFKLASDQSGSFFKVYLDPSRNSNDFLGTGFNDGTLILSGQANANKLSLGNFMQTAASGLFDAHNTNLYSNVSSVQGTGSLDFHAIIPASGINRNYVPLTAGEGIDFAFNTNLLLAFSETDPSQKFLDVTPTLGSTNGDGPDFQIQGDANLSPTIIPATAVPEPASALLLTVGLGCAGLFAARRGALLFGRKAVAHS